MFYDFFESFLWVPHTHIYNIWLPRAYSQPNIRIVYLYVVHQFWPVDRWRRREFDYQTRFAQDCNEYDSLQKTYEFNLKTLFTLFYHLHELRLEFSAARCIMAVELPNEINLREISRIRSRMLTANANHNRYESMLSMPHSLLIFPCDSDWFRITIKMLAIFSVIVHYLMHFYAELIVGWLIVMHCHYTCYIRIRVCRIVATSIKDTRSIDFREACWMEIWI